jgi:hypothetical protein
MKHQHHRVVLLLFNYNFRLILWSASRWVVELPIEGEKLTALRFEILDTTEDADISVSALVIDVFDDNACRIIDFCVGAYPLINLDQSSDSLGQIAATFFQDVLFWIAHRD